MTESLLIAGIVCIVGAAVGGGVKLLGNELPVLNSVPRQVFVFIIGSAFILASFLAGPSKSPSADASNSTTSPASASVAGSAAPAENLGTQRSETLSCAELNATSAPVFAGRVDRRNLEFTNSTENTVNIIWKSHDLGPVIYARLKPGETYSGDGNVDELWMVTDTNNQCISGYRVGGNGLNVRIRPDVR